MFYYLFFFFFSSRRRHTRFDCDWSSDVCSSDLKPAEGLLPQECRRRWIRNVVDVDATVVVVDDLDRKSTRLNSSHSQISYAVFCLKKKKQTYAIDQLTIRPHVHLT